MHCGTLLCFCIVGLSKAEIQAAVLESERRLAEKHARLEGAVVQVRLQLLKNPVISCNSQANIS